jgi:hypothetical protein
VILLSLLPSICKCNKFRLLLLLLLLLLRCIALL